MRENAASLLNTVQKQNKPTVIFHRNNPKAVLISITEYNRLMDLLEDYIDGELARELEKTKTRNEAYVPLAKVVRRFKVKI